KPYILVDRKGYAIGMLISPPVPGEEWADVVARVTAAFCRARDKMTFPADAYQHRHASGEGFPTAAAGFAFGVGRQSVGNIKATSARNAAAMDELMADPSVARMATYPIRESRLFLDPSFLTLARPAVMQATCYPIFAEYHRTKQTLMKEYPHLCPTFARSPFAAVTANLGPISVSPPHLDGNNKADGMCLIGALGSFNPDVGVHIVLWDYNTIIRFPPGCSSLIPSAVVTHSNTPIAENEERFSLIQYSAGSLFRW
ncbi:hypothetical protein C8R45DRAFT_769811, partial [Mycena sanguinolenta]